ncbi:MAG: hypothetical protein FJ109_08300 [Deltaproteobacteria bacterium]|nr:hypothetical protein [Deltaproteobacteria bacterium]
MRSSGSGSILASVPAFWTIALASLLMLQGCPADYPSAAAGQDASDRADENIAGGDAASDTVPEAGPDTVSEAGPDTAGPEVDPLDSFFSLDAVHTIEIQVDPAGVASLVTQPKVYVKAAVMIDDQLYPEVGVRLKGGMGSFVPIDQQQAWGHAPGKSAFIIDFNRFVKGQDHLGLKKLTVNNMVQDPSGIHQYLGYALFREVGVPASRSGFATVSFNGDDRGLYALVESPDNEEFLKRWFGSDNGNLYEGNGSDLTADGYGAFDQDRGDDTSKEDLRILSEALDAAPDGDAAYDVLDAVLDLEEYLTFAATELYLAHWDGYAWNTNNYQIYLDLDGALPVFLPWGVDQLFDETGILGPYHGIMKTPGPSWVTPSRGFDSLLHGGRVHQVCFASPKCRAKLGEAFHEVIAAADSMDLAALASAARLVVEPYLLSEAEQFGDPTAVEAALDQVADFIAARQTELAEWMPCLDGEAVDHDGDSHDGCVTDCDDWEPATHPGAAELCNLRDDDCSGILDDAPECPDCYDLTTPGGDYSLCFHPATWKGARARCQERGQDLASIHDEQTNLILPWNLMEKKRYAESWIGLNDRDEEGVFVWSDGSPYDFDYTLLVIPPEWNVWLDCTAFTLILGWLPQVCSDQRVFLCGSP